MYFLPSFSSRSEYKCLTFITRLKETFIRVWSCLGLEVKLPTMIGGLRDLQKKLGFDEDKR